MKLYINTVKLDGDHEVDVTGLVHLKIVLSNGQTFTLLERDGALSLRASTHTLSIAPTSANGILIRSCDQTARGEA